MLVVIEGIDGAGKHTQTVHLKARAEEAGIEVATLAFPRYGQTMMAEAVSDYLNGRYGTLEALPAEFPALLFAGDRLESRGLILEKMAVSDLLIIDRYVASNMAHQSAKVAPAERARMIDWIGRLEYGVYGLPRPDLTLYLDVPVHVSAELVARKKPRSYTDEKADLHERDLTYLQACRDVYTDLAASERWTRIAVTDADGTIRPPEAIHEDVWTAVASRLRRR